MAKDRDENGGGSVFKLCAIEKIKGITHEEKQRKKGAHQHTEYLDKNIKSNVMIMNKFITANIQKQVQ